MAKRREQPAETRPQVPAWVRECIDADWLPLVPAQSGDSWVHPLRWQQMQVHALWGATRRKWLSDHGIDCREWSTPEYLHSEAGA